MTLEKKNMKTLISCALLVFACASAHGEEPEFKDILSRVTHRDPITNAILKVNRKRRFKLEVEGDQARVLIWKHMKVSDPNQEAYAFPLSDLVRQEHARIQFQEELKNLINRCEDSEKQYRISQYEKYPVRAGMSYAEAAKLLKDEFKSDGQLRAEKGAYRLESDTHSIIFRHGILVDIINNEDL